MKLENRNIEREWLKNHKKIPHLEKKRAWPSVSEEEDERMIDNELGRIVGVRSTTSGSGVWEDQSIIFCRMTLI